MRSLSLCLATILLSSYVYLSSFICKAHMVGVEAKWNMCHFSEIRWFGLRVKFADLQTMKNTIKPNKPDMPRFGIYLLLIIYFYMSQGWGFLLSMVVPGVILFMGSFCFNFYHSRGYSNGLLAHTWLKSISINWTVISNATESVQTMNLNNNDKTIDDDVAEHCFRHALHELSITMTQEPLICEINLCGDKATATIYGGIDIRERNLWRENAIRKPLPLNGLYHLILYMRDPTLWQSLLFFPGVVKPVTDPIVRRRASVMDAFAFSELSDA